MDREQIIKALESCYITNSCRDCPCGVNSVVSTVTCKDVGKAAVALFKELTEENANLKSMIAEIEEGVKAAVSALQFENNPIHRKVKHETYSSFMRFVKTIEKKYTEEGK